MASKELHNFTDKMQDAIVDMIRERSGYVGQGGSYATSRHCTTSLRPLLFSADPGTGFWGLMRRCRFSFSATRVCRGLPNPVSLFFMVPWRVLAYPELLENPFGVFGLRPDGISHDCLYLAKRVVVIALLEPDLLGC